MIHMFGWVIGVANALPWWHHCVWTHLYGVGKGLINSMHGIEDMLSVSLLTPRCIVWSHWSSTQPSVYLKLYQISVRTRGSLNLNYSSLVSNLSVIWEMLTGIHAAKWEYLIIHTHTQNIIKYASIDFEMHWLQIPPTLLW